MVVPRDVEALGRGLRTELTAVGASSTVAFSKKERPMMFNPINVAMYSQAVTR